MVQNKVNSGLYQKLDQIFDDLSLMMDNAFSYYPRDSQRVQDAISLQRILLKKYTDLKGQWRVMLSYTELLK